MAAAGSGGSVPTLALIGVGTFDGCWMHGLLEELLSHIPNLLGRQFVQGYPAFTQVPFIRAHLITKYYIMSSCAMHFRMPSNNFQSMCCADAVGIACKPPFCLYIVQNSRRYMHMIQAHTQSFLNPRCACVLIKYRRCVIIMQNFLPFPLVLQKC